MPSKTAANIIWRFKTTRSRKPRKRGGAPKKFDSKKIAQFVFQYLSDPCHSNSTLEQIQHKIWTNRNLLLNENITQPPSISWISKLLSSKLFHSKPITLKFASYEPQIRNSPQVIEERFQFANMIQQLSDTEVKCILFLDEHGYNLFTVRHRARSVQGERAVVKTPTAKCQNVTVTLTVSPTFGKIHIQILALSTTTETFNYFLKTLHYEWLQSDKIPSNLKAQTPLLFLDNLHAHKILPENKDLFLYNFLPKYSPFLNLAEPVNRVHKQHIRKYQQENVSEIIPFLENLHWGEKNNARCELLRKIGHIAWNSITDSSIQNMWHHIVWCYMPNCLNKELIHA